MTSETKVDKPATHNDPAGANRMQPHNLDAERSVLGAMLQDREACLWAIENVQAEWFYKPGHDTIFETMRELSLGNKTVDLITVTNCLRERGNLMRLGGPAYIAGLECRVGTESDARYWADIIRRKYIYRQLISKGARLAEQGYAETSDPDEIIHRMRRDLDAAEKAIGNGHIDTAEIVPKLLARWERIKAGAMPFIPSGMIDIDKILGGGFPRGHIVHIKGERKKGKSSLMLQILDQIVNQGRKVFLASLEMRRDEVLPRIVAGRMFRSGRVDKEFNYTCLWNTHQWLEDNPDAKPYMFDTRGWWIDDRETLTPNQVITAFNYHIREWGVDVVALDHINLINLPESHTQQDKESFVERLRALAKAKEVVMIILTQLQPSDQWAYYYKTLEHVAGTIIHVDMPKEGKDSTLEVMSRFGPWGKRAYKFYGGVQIYQRPEGGGYYVPRRDSFRVEEANPAQEQSPQAEGRVDSRAGEAGESGGGEGGGTSGGVREDDRGSISGDGDTAGLEPPPDLDEDVDFF